ncbi:ogr/Delta-like zinc finger family protein [Sphingomonas arantia]|uniref:Ogr/Delta-like zinc finger family protein n=1 Tax=Sphingomonas arantia TaxID=1460676 RepID=A0ABW4TV30_9SPHN
MTRTTKSRNAGMACPHCAERMVVRTSQQVTLTVREAEYSCGGCGFRCVSQLSIIRVLRQPDVLNPEVPRLPFSNPNLQWSRAKPANDDAPLPANDDEVPPRVAVAAPLRPG